MTLKRGSFCIMGARLLLLLMIIVMIILIIAIVIIIVIAIVVDSRAYRVEGLGFRV